MVGDVVETGERIEETCRLLSDAGVIGVWGNHDFGLCCDVSEETRETYSQEVIQYMGSLKPRLEIGDCLFTHIEPWLDPTLLEDLWFFGGLPLRASVWTAFSASPPSTDLCWSLPPVDSRVADGNLELEWRIVYSPRRWALLCRGERVVCRSLCRL